MPWDRAFIGSRINRFFADRLREVRLLALADAVPLLRRAADAPPFQATAYPGEPLPPINDRHALIRDPRPPYALFEYWEADYACVKRRRQAGQIGNTVGALAGEYVLSASGVLCCAQSGELIVHRRSPRSDTYPGGLHIIGGAVCPTVDGRTCDETPAQTIVREVAEETGLAVQLSGATPLLVAAEFRTGFFLLGFLDVQVTGQALLTMQDSWEGRALRVPLAHLEDLLLGRGAYAGHRWVPSGMVHVLVWLALGAGGHAVGKEGCSAPELFDGVMTCLEQLAPSQCERLFAPADGRTESK
ncbi:MAG: NUDIX domain-containing protein [Magnetococcus sp. MYC-9]